MLDMAVLASMQGTSAAKQAHLEGAWHVAGSSIGQS